MTLLAGRDEATAPQAFISTMDKPPSRGSSETGRQCDDVQGQYVTCRVDELRPHPGYVRHHIAIPAFQLSPLAELGISCFESRS
jgi:hypothetical protein